MIKTREIERCGEKLIEIFWEDDDEVISGIGEDFEEASKMFVLAMEDKLSSFSDIPEQPIH